MKTYKYIIIVWFGIALSGYPGFSKEYSWNKIPYPAGQYSNDTLFSIHAFNENEAIAAGSNGVVTYANFAENTYSTIKCGKYSIRDICFSDSLNGWIVGDSGTIYSTNNRGTTWTQQVAGIKNNLNSVASTNPSQVWIAGDSGIILHSSDSGKNWERQKIELIPDISDTNDYFDLVVIAFKNDSVGVAGGNWKSKSKMVVLLTCDGGLHWKALDCPDPWMQIFNVGFKEEKTILYVDDAYSKDYIFLVEKEDFPCFFSFHTDNIRSRLERDLENPRPAHKIFDFPMISNQKIFATDSVNSMVSWIAGTNGSIYRATDGAKNWISVNGGKNYGIDHLVKINFSDKQHGFIGGQNGTLLTSNDSGRTWGFSERSINASISINEIVFSDSLCGFLVVQPKLVFKGGYLLSTNDGGRTWQTNDGSPSEIYFLRKVKQTEFIGLGWEYIYYFNPNGDKNWKKHQITTDLSFFDFFPITYNTFFSVGSRGNILEGAIYKSSDFGESFDLTSVDHADSKNTNFFSITFSEPSTGWVVGEKGIILKSIDSGYTWKRQPSPTSDSLFRIRFCNPDFGWMFGGRRIYLTFDGGDTWQDKSILTSTRVNDVLCSDPENCWAVGDDGLILHLSNKLDKYIKIISPGRDTQFVIGDSFTVKWNSAGISQVSIALSYDNGENYTIYRSSTENDFEEIIRIAANAKASNICKIRIRSEDGTVQDESEQFTITQNNAIENRRSAAGHYSCRFTAGSIQYSLIEDTPVEITIYTVSGREVYRNRIPMQPKGVVVQKIPPGVLYSGCYLAQVKIGGKLFNGKLFLHR